MNQSSELDAFTALSKILTGEEELDPTLAEQYLARLKEHNSVELQNILAEFSLIANDPYRVFEVKRRIVETKEKGKEGLPAMAQRIIRIWFTAEFSTPELDATGKPVLDSAGKPKEAFFGGTQTQYYRGLLWTVIQAHAPTNSQQEYGYWINKP